MRRYRVFSPYLLALVCVAAVFCIAAHEKESGRNPYVPTRLEWLQLQGELAALSLESSDLRFGLHVSQSPPNAIKIRITLLPGFEDRHEDVVASHVALMKQILMDEAGRRAWDDWLEIEVSMKDSRRGP